jgi:hypothetical protein
MGTVRWVLTIETTEMGHSHIDVDDPETAAIVINEINEYRAEEGKGPAHTRLDSFEKWWSCDGCSEKRVAGAKAGT